MKPTANLLRREYRCRDLLYRVGNVTTQHARILIVPLLFAVVLAARGCAAPQRVPPSEAHFALIALQPAAEPLLATDLFPENRSVQRYLVVGGEDFGSHMVFKREPTEQHGASWAHLEGDLRTEYWSTDDAGNVQLRAVFETQDQAVSLFDPPLTIPHRIRPGEVHQEEVSMRVVDARNPAVQKASGTATRTVEYVDDRRIQTPLGVLDAQRLVVHFLADMGVAKAESTSVYYIVPGLGMVAEELIERVSILGMFGRASDRTIVLVQDE